MNFDQKSGDICVIHAFVYILKKGLYVSAHEKTMYNAICMCACFIEILFICEEMSVYGIRIVYITVFSCMCGF